MCRGIIFIVYLVLLYVLLLDIVRSHVHVDSTEACAHTHCNRSEHCVDRKFWCKNPPCPRMIYCSKTRRESLKGPTTCQSVRCSRGYFCHVRVRRCRWDQKCEHQMTRCVSELDYSHEPASCADFNCSSGYRCILKESLCSHPPCKLLKSCAKEKEVGIWHSRCRTLGCPSEYECFLRRPQDNCFSTNSCKHTADCTVTNAKQHPMDSYCSGWVCPRDQECLALTPKSCNPDDGDEGCKVNRTCTKSPTILERKSSPPSSRLIPRASTTISNTRGREPQIENSGAFQIASQPDDRESHVVLSTIQSTSSAIEFVREATSSKTDCDLINSTVHRGRNMQSEKMNLPSDSIYRTPVYFRSSVNKKSLGAGEPSGEEEPIDPSITQWLDDLFLKTGVDAIGVWAEYAEQNREYEQFVEWLTAVRTTLGPVRFEIWLEEIRKLTTTIPAFQKWLPASRSTEGDSNNGNGREQDIRKVLSDRNQEPQSQTQQGYETTEGPVDSTGILVSDYNAWSTSHFPGGIGKTADKLTKTFHDVGQQAEKRWAWRYDRPGIFQNVQPAQELGDQRRMKELEEWLMKSGHPQSFGSTDLKIEPTIIPSSSIPKQPFRSTVRLMLDKGVPIDVTGSAQFGRELDVYPLYRSGNDRSIFSVDEERSKQPARKNVGHPRINYGRSPAAELRNGTQTWYWRNNSTDQLQMRVHETDENYFQTKNVTSVELADRDINSAKYPSTLVSPIDSEVQGSTDSGKSQDLNGLSDKSKNPEGKTNYQKPRELTGPRQFPEEDQKEFSKGSKTPEHDESRHYGGVQDSYHRGLTENSSVDLRTRNKNDKTKTYNLVPPTEPIMFDDEKISYYTLLEFLPKEVTEELQLTGYPLTVSRAASIDRSNSFSQSGENPHAIISPYLESDVDSWGPNLQHKLLSPATKYFDQAIFQDQKREIDSRGRQASLQSRHDLPSEQQVLQERAKGQKYFPNNRLKPLHSLVAPNELTRQLPQVLLVDGTLEPIERFLESQNDHGYKRINWILRDSGDSIPTRREEGFEQQSPFHVRNSFDNLYKWRGRIPQRLSEVSRTSSRHPSEDGFEDYPSTLTSQEYSDAYLDTLIEDALAEIILNRQLQENESAADRKNSKDLGSDGQYVVGIVQRAQQTTTISSPSSIISEIDDPHECGNNEMNPSPTGSAIGEEYGDSVDNGQQEYFDRSSRYRDEYLGNLEIDLTNYDFQYYYDEDKVILTKNEEV